jgi:PKD repeat protein
MITSGQTLTGKVGVAFSQTPASTGVITSWALASGNSLPAGLSLNTTTGAITGTPIAKGSFTVSLTVTGGGGASVAGVAFAITDGVPIIAVSQVLRGGVRRIFSMVPSLTDAANRAVLDWRAAGLPAWATINTSTGEISGFPEIVGDVEFTLTVTGPGGSDSKVLGISVEDLAVILYRPGFEIEGHANDIILRERRFIFARWTGKGLIPPGMNWMGTDEGLRIWGTPYSEGIWEAEFEGPYPANFESDLTSGGSSEPPLQLDAGDLPGEIVVERFAVRFEVEEQTGYTYGQVLKELFTNPSVEQTARRAAWAATTCIGARPLSGAFLESGVVEGVNLNESFGFASTAANLAQQINGSELATAISGQSVLGVEIVVTALEFGALAVAASSTNQGSVQTRIATQGSATVKQVSVITLTGQFRGGVTYSVTIGDKFYLTTTQAPSKAGLWFYAAPGNVGDAEGSTARCLRNSDLGEQDYAASDWLFSLPAVIERSQEGCLLTAGVAGSALLDGVRRTVAVNSVIPL